jgi:hypothetical protein
VELGIGRQAVEEDRDFSGVVLGPVGLREHVVNYIKTAGGDEYEGFVGALVFSRDGVSKDQIKL